MISGIAELSKVTVPDIVPYTSEYKITLSLKEEGSFSHFCLCHNLYKQSKANSEVLLRE